MSRLRTQNTVGAYNAKTHFSKLLERVEAGDEITITKHGNPVARLSPVRKKSTPAHRRQAIERWRKSSQSLTLGRLKVRDLIEQGRR